MTPLASSSLAALVAVVVSAATLYSIHNRRAHEAAGLRSENDRMRLEATRRHRARQMPPPAPSPSATSVETALPLDSRSEAPSAPGDYRHEGQASPLATLQTFAWACDRGDHETIRRLLCFEAPGRAKAEAFMATLPPDVRTRWHSPEEMAAELLTHQGMQQPFPAAHILERAVAEPQPDGTVRLRLPGTPKDGTVYRKIGDRWHYVITDASVERYIAERTPRRPDAP